MLKKSQRIVGIGSPRASIESNFALREVVGAENFYSGISASEQKRLTLMLEILQKVAFILHLYVKLKITMRF